jgi:dephospho-CoA kinase
MLAIGLTGGIGAGKSLVADLLARRGAVIVDADRIAREVVSPGGPAYAPLVRRFGASVVLPDGTIDRPALAAVAFHDAQALADLNAITHPVIGAAMADRLVQLTGSDTVAVVAIPLLTAAHRSALGLQCVVVVDCPTELAIERLVRLRGMDPEDARARVAAQQSREERLELADYVVDNSSSYEHLVDQVSELWARIEELRQRH